MSQLFSRLLKNFGQKLLYVENFEIKLSKTFKQFFEIHNQKTESMCWHLIRDYSSH
jgi:hypothetical protein